MDINTTALPTATIKTPDAESENPTRIQPTKPLPLTNGVLKRHHPLHHHRTSPPPAVTYKECLKNHAASLGGHALDGCGEFMPSPTSVPTDPTSLKCAACGCHRNFHRRDPEETHPQSTPAPAQHVIEYQPHHRHHPLPPPRGGRSTSPNSPSPPPISSSYYPSAPHMLLALSAGLAGGPPPDNNQAIGNSPGAGAPSIGNPNGRKRFRTKFTQQQKEKMHEFAERVGWKMQKRDEETISEFCSQIGVDRGVLKVWMHNNKSTLGKKEANNTNGTTNTTNSTTTQYHIQINNNNNDIENSNTLNLAHQFHHNNDSTVSGRVVATNGSSSSS